MSSLVPKTRIKIGISNIEIKHIAASYDLTYEEVLEQIQEMLKEVLYFTIGELKTWIKKKVPKRTGQLRDNLIANLDSSRVKKGLMRLILGTNISYAEFVTNMTTSQVRHSGEIGYAYYYGHYGRIVLNDPEAIGDFFRELIYYAKERIQMNLSKAKARHLGFGSYSTKIKRALG